MCEFLALTLRFLVSLPSGESDGTRAGGAAGRGSPGRRPGAAFARAPGARGAIL